MPSTFPTGGDKRLYNYVEVGKDNATIDETADGQGVVYSSEDNSIEEKNRMIRSTIDVINGTHVYSQAMDYIKK